MPDRPALSATPAMSVWVLLLLLIASAAGPSRAQGLQSERALAEQQRLTSESVARSGPPRIVLFTPAWAARLTISGADDRSLMTMGLNNAVSRRRNELLNERVAGPDFDPQTHFAKALLAALQQGRPNSPPLQLRVSRSASARLGTLSREDFPADDVAALLKTQGSASAGDTPTPAYVLDVTIHEFGLMDGGALYGGLRPTIYSAYRVLSADGSIVQLTRAVMLNSTGPRRLGTYDHGAPAPPLKESLVPHSRCRFAKLPEKDEEIALVRQCLKDALSQVAARIADDPLLVVPAGTAKATAP